MVQTRSVSSPPRGTKRKSEPSVSPSTKKIKATPATKRSGKAPTKAKSKKPAPKAITKSSKPKRTTTKQSGSKTVNEGESANSLPRMFCRDEEKGVILQFLTDAIEKREGGSLYVCGSPGTGKTALVTNILEDLGIVSLEQETNLKQRATQPRVVSFNAMTLCEPRLVYLHIARALLPPDHAVCRAGAREQDIIAAVESVLVPGKGTGKGKGGGRGKTGMILMVADEIDQLITQDQAVLYRLFDWASRATSRLALIGIANNVNLAHRFLPRLRQQNCLPEHLVFPAYDKQSLRTILLDTGAVTLSQDPTTSTSRSSKGKGGGEHLTTFDSSALDLCCMKVAKLSGDMRKALQLCRRAITVARRRVRSEQAAAAAAATSTEGAAADNESFSDEEEDDEDEGEGLDSAAAAATAAAAAAAAGVRVTVKVSDMARTLREAFASRTCQSIKALPMRAQLVLCHTLLLCASSTRASTPVYPLFSAVGKAQRETTMAEFSDDVSRASLSITDFLGYLTRLRETGLVELTGKGHGRLGGVVNLESVKKLTVRLSCSFDDIDLALGRGERKALFRPLLVRARESIKFREEKGGGGESK